MSDYSVCQEQTDRRRIGPFRTSRASECCPGADLGSSAAAPRVFGRDGGEVSHSAKVRSGELQRDQSQTERLRRDERLVLSDANADANRREPWRLLATRGPREVDR
jgi:hypothetical protein